MTDAIDINERLASTAFTPQPDTKAVSKPVPLDELAAQINNELAIAAKHDDKAHDLRLAAGKKLKEARSRPELQEHGAWGRWLKDNISRSRADVYRCLKLVESDDPVKQDAARETEKADRRESDKRRAEMSHDRETGVSSVDPTACPVSAEDPTAGVPDVEPDTLTAEMVIAWFRTLPVEAQCDLYRALGKIHIPVHNRHTSPLTAAVEPMQASEPEPAQAA